MEYITWNSILESFFDKETMSVHFKENVHILRKKWRPGNWQSEILEDEPSKNYLTNLINDLYKEVEKKDDSFLEIDRRYSKVLQIWPYRTVIVLPPLSDGIEITVVKPVKKLSIEDYNLEPRILELLKDRAQWILISWAPWEGKTTFAQALIEVYVKQNKIIKTVEAPRDLLVPNEVTQYSFSYAPHSEVRDILLLSRPDYTVYDEVRNSEDFHLFKDLRLTWIWLVWVIHATNPVDSIQRFLGTIEMWVIPQVIDTVIFIKWWAIKEIFQLDHKVKVPAWMESNDLARPVIQVIDFFNDEVKFEIYSYWEQIVVMPLDKISENKAKKSSWLINYWVQYLNEIFSEKFKFQVLIKAESDNWVKIYIPEKFKWQVIWKWWANITQLEKELGINISVRTIEELPIDQNTKIDMVTSRKGSKVFLTVKLPSYPNTDLNLKIWDEVYAFTSDIKWEINIKNKDLISKIEKYWISLINKN